MSRRRKIKKMRVEHFDSKKAEKLSLDPGWYIYDPNGDIKWVGPYATKAEAIEDRRGLERFWRYEYV